MKFNQPHSVGLIALLASWVLRIWLVTINYRFIIEDLSAVPKARGHRIYLFWHEMMLFPAFTHAGTKVAVLISQHRDGELISRIIRMLGLGSVRGSTKKQGASAVRKLMRKGKIAHLAITPDGPRGPRRVIQPGCVYLASRTGLSIVPAGFAYVRVKRVGSWDRMALPIPFTTGYCVVGHPIDIPAGIDMTQIETWRNKVQQAMDAVQNQADAMAEGRAGRIRTISLNIAKRAGEDTPV